MATESNLAGSSCSDKKSNHGDCIGFGGFLYQTAYETFTTIVQEVTCAVRPELVKCITENLTDICCETIQNARCFKKCQNDDWTNNSNHCNTEPCEQSEKSTSSCTRGSKQPSSCSIVAYPTWSSTDEPKKCESTKAKQKPKKVKKEKQRQRKPSSCQSTSEKVKHKKRSSKTHSKSSDDNEQFLLEVEIADGSDVEVVEQVVELKKSTKDKAKCQSKINDCVQKALKQYKGKRRN